MTGLIWVEASQPDPLVDAARLLYEASRMSGAAFLRALGGYVYRTDEQPDLDFDGAVADDEVVAEAWQTWRAEVAHAQQVTAALASFDQLVGPGDEQGEVRDVLVHLVEEYARHCGHADLLREAVDGRTGQ